MLLLLARLSFVTNSPLNMVFTFTLPCLSTASRTCSRATFPASSKNRHDSTRLEFITTPVNILSNMASISRQTRDRSLPLAYATNVHDTSLQLRLCTCESCDPRHRGLSVSNGEARTRQSSSSCSLQPCETPE